MTTQTEETAAEIREISLAEWKSLAETLRTKMRQINEARSGIETVSVVQENAGVGAADQ